MLFYKHPTAVVESGDIGEGTKIWHFVHVREGAKIGKKCIIGKSVYIDKDVEIGDNVKIENFACIYKGVIIEDNVFIGPAVVFTNDKYPQVYGWVDDKIVSTLVKKGAIIGANATIVCGVVISEDAMVGAGAVVTKDVQSAVTVVGNPAQKI